MAQFEAECRLYITGTVALFRTEWWLSFAGHLAQQSAEYSFHSRILIWRTSSLVFIAAPKCVKLKKCNQLTNFFHLLRFSHSTGFYSRYLWFTVYDYRIEILHGFHAAFLQRTCCRKDYITVRNLCR